MTSKCSRRFCNFSQEVAHMDEAVEALRQHYRALHPTKAFYLNRALETLEQWNQDADDVFEQNNVGPEGAPQYDWVHLRAFVIRARDPRYGDSYIQPSTIDEVERRVAEHDAAAPAPGEVLQDAAAPLIDWIEDGIVEAREHVPLPAAGVVPPFVQDAVQEIEDGF